mmetsp:Transcript_30249/g.73061  ORF Transcript_30249/g.73061 Transcript_30249/m.73061 type:complete len:107 (+) Transcript_30249:130-450(+)
MPTTMSLSHSLEREHEPACAALFIVYDYPTCARNKEDIILDRLRSCIDRCRRNLSIHSTTLSRISFFARWQALTAQDVTGTSTLGSHKNLNSVRITIASIHPPLCC